MDARKSKKDQIKTKLRNRLIHSACRTGDIQKVRSLLQNDFDCKFDEDQREKMIPYLGGGVSPLHCGAEQGRQHIMYLAIFDIVLHPLDLKAINFNYKLRLLIT